MVKSTQPRGVKPKAEGTQSDNGKDTEELNGTKFIITNAIVTLVICIVFVASNYFIVQSSVGTIASKIAGGDSAASADGTDAAAAGEGDQVERGLILDLGEFILNLSDTKTKRYLKVDVAVELSKLPTDPKEEAAGGGEGEKKGPSPMEAFAKEMDQFKPAIRDSIITVLSSKAAEELSSAEGKEKAKDEIKEGINAVFGGEREVLRVSFGTFIIQ
ncbi:MAG: flagellar basal body-associated FliL family protein [bacterium]